MNEFEGSRVKFNFFMYFVKYKLNPFCLPLSTINMQDFTTYIQTKLVKLVISLFSFNPISFLPNANLICNGLQLKLNSIKDLFALRSSV